MNKYGMATVWVILRQKYFIWNKFDKMVHDCLPTHARTDAHTSDILFPRYDHNERLFQHILPIRLVLYITLVLCVLDEEKIEYTKGVFRSRKSRKNRQQNGLKKMAITETSGTH
jgi:hypothetical protein